ncbi:uncharacterized protein LY89DRAFT_445737 [Mollisia scopiformis]|uniref:Uncharacterized protein n=1 Tax=Mollisia scopiformis TaxID=149040 RepID=A0A194XK34_MOLSC|nr:uncharacterized protein LY89DRAFT_445737 [Mollisia scopiformis]KUJ20518.1 hypothetical protein LY89DRAFT_445737 [Mollisia scopiformis]
MASSSSTHDFSQRDLTELSALEETSPNPQSNSYSAHDVYFSYFYSGVTEHSNVIDANAMEDRWKFHPECNSVSKPHLEGFVVDETPCSSGYLWLLASLALTLETHLTPQDAVFAVLSEVFDLSTLKNSNTFTHGPLTPRLKSDVNYWISFAKSRRMQDAMSQETFDYHLLHGHPKEDLINLLILLLTNTNSHRKPHEGLSLTLRAEGGPTRTIVRSLRDVGLPFAMPVSESIMMHELDSNIIEFGTPRLIFSCAEDLGTYQRSLLD